jgi:UDPglucose--hexose-1-phosphate uridylyltransferase
MLRTAQAHRQRTGRSVFADVLAAEQAAGTRVVASNASWTAFVPPFARWPFEVHVYPHRQVPDIPALSDAERDAFGPVHLDVLRRLDAVHGLAMPYVAAWHQAPVNDGRDLAYLHLQLFSNRRAPGLLKHPAGTEAAMGVFLNDVDPDHAARLLRAAPSS